MVSLFINIKTFVFAKIAGIGLGTILKASAWVTAFISPITELLMATGFFIMADFGTGIWKTVKKSGWSSVRSEKMWNTVTKMVLYLLSVIVAYVANTYIFPEQLPFLEIITGFICMTELKSIYENIGETTGIDIWKQVIDYINRQRANK